MGIYLIGLRQQSCKTKTFTLKFFINEDQTKLFVWTGGVFNYPNANHMVQAHVDSHFTKGYVWNINSVHTGM